MELVAPPRCTGCNGACFWYRAQAAHTLELPVQSPLPVGAAVSVTLPDRWLLLGASFLYGVPLAALLAGAAAGNVWFGSDLAAAAGAALALGGALLTAPGLRSRLERATLRQLAVHAVGEGSP